MNGADEVYALSEAAAAVDICGTGAKQIVEVSCQTCAKIRKVGYVLRLFQHPSTEAGGAQIKN